MNKILTFCILILFVCVLIVSCSRPADDSNKTSDIDKKKKNIFATIGTGGITGVYYPTGGAIAKMVNQNNDEHGIRCTVESTGGSVFNINAVMNGDLQFGIAQSDRQYQAMKGLAEWGQKGPQNDIRAIFSIHSESVTLVAAVDAGIMKIEDLRGKRVNIGNPGSGQRQNAIDALWAAGIDYKNDLAIACNNQGFIAEAPIIIVACALEEAAYGVMGGYMSSYPIDISIALEHLMLAATEVGLGTCWIGSFKENLVKGILGVPENIRVVALTPLGYPDREPRPVPRKELSEIVFYDKYGS